MKRWVRWSMGSLVIVAALSMTTPTEAKHKLENKLWVAAGRADTVTIRELLAKGADANYVDDDGITPLMAAVGAGAKQVWVYGPGGKDAFERSGYAEIAKVKGRPGAPETV